MTQAESITVICQFCHDVLATTTASTDLLICSCGTTAIDRGAIILHYELKKQPS